MKNLLLALALALIGTPLLADKHDRPEGMFSQTVPILLNCFDSFARMVEVLGDQWGEAPVLISQMNEKTTVVLFVNEDKTTSTLVITRITKNSEETCIMWSGASDGMSFSLNPQPNFPPKKTET
jgi:hypothetical protein